MLLTFSLFAEEELSILFRDLNLVKEVNEEINDRLPYLRQLLVGERGE